MKIQQKFCKCRKICKIFNFVKFQKFQLDNLVDFEKCCKTRFSLQRSTPIQPKTIEILPKFGNYPTGPRRGRADLNGRAGGRAQLLAKRGSIGQMQISAELVPIPDASRMRRDTSGYVRMRRDASGCVGMRRDFEFRQISANSGKIPA